MKQHQTNSFISRAAAMLLTVIMAFAGAQTAGAQNTCNVTFDISGKGTVEFGGETVTNDETIVCNIPSGIDLTITPETGYVVSSVTYDATDGLNIFLGLYDDFQWNLNINSYLGSDTPTITVRIVFDKALAGGADEASAVALTADYDLSHLTGGWYKVESDLTLGHTVNLHGDTHITIATGKTLTVSTSDEYGIYGSALTVEYGISGSALTVSGEGTLAVSASEKAIYVDNYTQMGCAVTLSGDYFGLTAENNVSISGGSLTTSGAIIGIESNQGAITISGGTVSASGDSAGLFAGDAVSITGGTVSASGNNYGIRGLSVSITGGQVNVSSGGIRSIFGDITLGLTSATDYITANGFTVEEGFYVKIADGQKLYGGGFPSASYNGTIGDPSALNGKTLRPTAAVTESGTNEYTIWNADGWDAFCDALQDNDTYNRFSGKTVKLAADITVSRMAGSSQHDFCGTFDGQEHTLTFTSTENVNGVAPFSYVSETTPTGGTEVSHPAIRNLNVVADINTTAQYASALVGRMWCTLTIEGCTVGGTIQTSNKYAAGFIAEQNGDASITDCRSSVTINSSVEGDGTHGGFVAAVYSGTVNVTGCLFDGKLLTTNGTTHCAGFVGYGACNITNSLYAPADIGQDETEAGTDKSATFARGEASGITIANCYYTSDFNDGTSYTGQGKQLRSIAAGEGVTISHAGEATTYDVSGITAYKASDACGDSDPFIAGIIYNNVLYAGSGDAVSLTLTNSAGDAPLGYKYGDYSATGGATLSGSTLTMADDNVTVSFTPGALRSTGQAVSVSYIDADGQPASHNAIALDGTETEIGQDGEETWYFVGADISHSGKIECYGNVNIILADGYTMTVNNDDGIFGVGYTNDILTIYGQTFGTGTLDITANNNGIYYGIVVIRSGTVNATGTYQNGITAYGDVTITGGKVTATGNNDGIYSYEGNITITGGQVTATSEYSEGIFAYGDVTITGGQVNVTSDYSDGIFAGGDITLGCTNASDFIKATSYRPGIGKSVNIADGQTLYDEDGNEYSCDWVGYYYDLAGKTLRPLPNVLALDDAADNSAAITANDRETRNVILYGRTLYKDGDWNTLCLPFSVGDEEAESGHELDGTPLEGATLMTLGNSQACKTGFDAQTGTLNLDFLPATTVEPGVAYIVKWPIPDGMTAEQFAAAYAANPDAYDLKNPVFTGVSVTNDAPADHAVTSQDGYVTFVGTYSPTDIYSVAKQNLYLGAGNALYYPDAEGFALKSFRAYFQLNNGLTAGEPSSPNAVRAFNLSFGDGSEANGIEEVTTPLSPARGAGGEAWFSLDGVRLDAQPTRKGVYIVNGRKVVIK